MIELDHEDAGLDVDASVAAGKIAHVLTALLASMRLEAIGSPLVREANRVATLLARDAEYAAEERAREAAVIEIADGLTVNVIDTVVPPTPEWLAKTPTRPVYVGGDNWTDRSAHEPLKTVRRVVTSHADRALAAGRITVRQAKACEWYLEQHSLSGLAGNIASSGFEPRIAGGINGGTVFSPAQLDAQDELRNAQSQIPLRLRPFFDMVVIEGIAIKPASRKVYAGRDPIDSFRCCADRVADYVEYSTRKAI